MTIALYLARREEATLLHQAFAETVSHFLAADSDSADRDGRWDWTHA
jgi:hypothetical protein